MARRKDAARGWATFVFVLLGSPATFVAWEAMAEGTPTAFEAGLSIGNRTWSQDLRITRTGYDDYAPQLTVDANHDAHFVWRSDRPPSGYYLLTLDRVGSALTLETYITGNVPPTSSISTPRGPTIAIDSGDALHVVSDGADNESIVYEKFDSQGNELVAAKKVGVSLCVSCHAPTVAIKSDDTVIIANENYKFRCEDITVNKLDNSGNEIWVNRVVSSDVLALAGPALVKSSRFSGNDLFTFGSDNGTWLSRMNKFGVKDMASVQLRTPGDFRIVDVAETPNGNMHAVWADDGVLYYAVVNATGTKIADSRVLVSGSVAPYAYPRVEATSDNRVFIVWNDTRTGTSQIFMTEIAAGEENDSAAPTTYQLSDTSGSASEPAVAIDPDDAPRIVWVDTRDGNREIYYKFSYGCAIELYAEPIELGGMFFLHPGETNVLRLTLKNKGVLAQNLSVTADVSPQAIARGWNVSLAPPPQVVLIAGNSTMDLNLSVQAPLNATDGDYITVEINASSLDEGGCSDALHVVQYVHVTRGLRLYAGEPVLVADYGQVVAFNLIAKNTGDVPEAQVDIVVGGTKTPPGWVVTADKPSLALEPGQSDNFTVFVQVPRDVQFAPCDFFGFIGVTIRSAADPTAQAAIGLTVLVRCEIFLTVEGVPAATSGMPGETMDFSIKITNEGNLAGAAQINLTTTTSGPSGWTSALGRERVYLAGGENITVGLRVNIPRNATALSNISILVNAHAVRWGIQANVTLSLTAREVCGLLAHPGAASTAGRDHPSKVDINLTNVGNSVQHLTLAPVGLPAGWTMRFIQSGSTVSMVSVSPSSSTNFSVEVTPTPGALAGVQLTRMMVASTSCGAFEVALSTNVEPFENIQLSIDIPTIDGALGTTASFDFVVTNAGNALTMVLVTTGGLPPNVATTLVLLEEGLPPELASPIAGDLTLAAGESVNLRLRLALPNALDSDRFDLRLVATSGRGLSASRILSVVVLRADLSIAGATVTPTPAFSGESATARIEVRNVGVAPSPGGGLDFYFAGALAGSAVIRPLMPGEGANLSISWSPTPGTHVLRFVAQLDNGYQEVSVDNNEFSLEESFQPRPVSGPMVADLTVIALIAVVPPVATLGAFLLWRRRRAIR